MHYEYVSHSTFKNARSEAIMYQNTFVSHCARNNNHANTDFKAKYAVRDLNIMHEFRVIQTMFETCKDKQIKRNHKHFSTLLLSVKNCWHNNTEIDQ